MLLSQYQNGTKMGPIQFGVDTSFHLNFGNPKNSRRYPITPKISKYRRLNLTKNRYQQTPRNMPNFTLIPRCRGKVSSSHCAAAPRFSWSWTSRPTCSSGGHTFSYVTCATRYSCHRYEICVCKEILQLTAYKCFFFHKNLTHTQARKGGFWLGDDVVAR